MFDKKTKNRLLRAKCLIAGDPSVGKSALVQVFHSDHSHFPKNYSFTPGIELCVKSIMVPDTTDYVELFLYDSAGKEMYSDFVLKHWDQPSVIALVFDITSESSFNACSKWLDLIRSRNSHLDVPGVLIGNKADLEERRVISQKAGEVFAQSNKLEYFEASAKEMKGIEEAFQYLAKAFYDSYDPSKDLFRTVV